MSTQLWWIFDALTVIIVILVMASNIRRGMRKVLVFGIGYIVATLFASVFGAIAAPTLYEAVAERSDISAIETANSHIDLVAVFTDAMEAQQYGFKIDSAKIKEILTGKNNAEFDTELYEYANRNSGTPVSEKSVFMHMIRDAFVSAYGEALGERLPHYVKMNFEQQVTVNPSLMRDIIVEFYNPKHSAMNHAEFIEERFSREPTTEVLQIFIFLISFSVLMVVAALISAALQNQMYFSMLPRTDRILGGLLGLLETAVMLIILTVVVRLIVMLSGGTFFCFNDTAIHNSKIFIYLYDNIHILL